MKVRQTVINDNNEGEVFFMVSKMVLFNVFNVHNKLKFSVLVLSVDRY